MTAFKVKTDSLYRSGEGLEQAAARLASVSRRLGSVSGAWVLQNNAFAGVRRGLRRSSESVSWLGDSAAGMQDTLCQIARIYERTEHEALTGCAEAGAPIQYELPGELPPFWGGQGVGPHAAPDSDDGDDGPPRWWEALSKVLGSMGLAGLGLSLVGNIGFASWFDAMKDMSKMVGQFGELCDAPGLAKIGWKDLLQGEKYSTSLRENFEDAVGKFGIPEKGASVGKKLSAAMAWVDVALELADKGFSNYDEFGGFSDRMVRETITETAIDLGFDLGLGTLVGTGLAAVAGSIGLPVTVATVGVAVVSAVVVAGVDWLLDCAADGDWVEKVSDAVNNSLEAAAQWVDKNAEAAAEWVGDKVNEAGKWAGEKIGDAVDAVKDTINCAWKGVTGLFAH